MLGGAVGLGMLYRKFYEGVEGERWIPERREKEREFEQYMDALRYVKHTKLFREYADEAKYRERVDVEKLIHENAKANRDRLAHRKFLEDLKRELRTDVDSSPARLINSINRRLRERGFGYVQGDTVEELFKNINKQITRLGKPNRLELETPLAQKAYDHYMEAEGTLYAFDKGDSIQAALASLPRKDRRYLRHFINAPSEERDEILELVPGYTRRILQAAWGREVDEKPDLVRDIFTRHELPDANWAGWRENVSLDDVKVKIIKREALDASEHDVWPDDKHRAERVNVPVPQLNVRTKASIIKGRLHDLLGGVGVENLDIEVAYTATGAIDIDMDIEQDRREEAKALINRHRRSLFG